MKESLNQVEITGIVSEVNVRDIDKGANGKFIAGEVVVRVEEKGEISEIPVGFISKDVKKDGTPNKLYAQLQQLKEYNSIASAGLENATKVSIRGARINENLFMPLNGTEVISVAKVSSNFFTKVNGTSFKPSGKFRVIGNILQIVDEEKSEEGEMVPTGRLIVRAALIGYNDKLDVVKFVVETPDAIAFIKANWKEKDTVQIGGRLRYTEELIEKVEEVGFGEADVKTFTKRTREFLIESGSAEALDEENSYSEEDIKKALMNRKERMEEIKQKAAQPKPQEPIASASNDFGF